MKKLSSCAFGDCKEVVGLLPAGGKATRLGLLPCSKEIYPVGYAPAVSNGDVRCKVAASGLLGSMKKAGANKAFFILRQGKWDIPAYYGHGGMLNMHIAYLMMDKPFGAPYTVDQAYPFIPNAVILFGFPDILFRPEDAFATLLERQSQTGATLVLGAFKADTPSKMDMLDLDHKKKIRDIIIKPAATTLTHTWIIAAWTPEFSHFLHEYVADDFTRRFEEKMGEKGSELYMGDVIRAAVKAGQRVETVFFDQGAYVDIGTPEDMLKVMSDPNWTFGGKE